jgi:hypothetical protein
VSVIESKQFDLPPSTVCTVTETNMAQCSKRVEYKIKCIPM